MPIALAMALAVQPTPYSPSRKAAACAAADTVRIAPGDMLQLLDDFRASLSPQDRQRLDRTLPRSAAGGIAECDTVEGSRASCEAAAYMPALRRTRLMPRFLATICPAATDAGARKPAS